MTIDQRCHQLAEHVLSGGPFNVDKETDELASVIREAVRGWFSGLTPADVSDLTKDRKSK